MHRKKEITIALYVITIMSTLIFSLLSLFYLKHTYRLLGTIRDEEVCNTIMAQNVCINGAILYCLMTIMFMVMGVIVYKSLLAIINNMKKGE